MTWTIISSRKDNINLIAYAKRNRNTFPKGHYYDLPLPSKATVGSAGFDLSANIATPYMTRNGVDMHYPLEYEGLRLKENGSPDFSRVKHPRQKLFEPLTPDHPVRDWTVVSTGWHIRIPPGYVGHVCSRSGLAAHRGVFVLNAPGIIDSDYTGEIKVILARVAGGEYLNDNDYKPEISHGNRIAQLIFMPLWGSLEPITEIVELPGDEWDALNAPTKRGEGGLGSTGVAA